MTVSPQLRTPSRFASRREREQFRKALMEAADMRRSQLEDLPRAEGDPMLRAQRDALEQVLKEITSALGRLEEGQFGRCSACAEPIPVERLEVRPWSSRCVRCARR